MIWYALTGSPDPEGVTRMPFLMDKEVYPETSAMSIEDRRVYMCANEPDWDDLRTHLNSGDFGYMTASEGALVCDDVEGWCWWLPEQYKRAARLHTWLLGLTRELRPDLRVGCFQVAPGGSTLRDAAAGDSESIEELDTWLETFRPVLRLYDVLMPAIYLEENEEWGDWLTVAEWIRSYVRREFLRRDFAGVSVVPFISGETTDSALLAAQYQWASTHFDEAVIYRPGDWQNLDQTWLTVLGES